MIELKPCPFCGSIVTQLRDREHPFTLDAFYCPKCKCRFRWGNIDLTKKSASTIERKCFNRRAKEADHE